LRTHKVNAFTTIELLMAIALIGLLAAAAIGPDESFFHGIGDEPLDETLRKAVREARYQAVNTGGRMTLSWDEEARSFVISDATGSEIERIKSDAKGEKDEISFLRIESSHRVEVPEGDLTLAETDRIIFDADRCATPFVAKMHYAGADLSVRYDPFSNLRMEIPK
jgi:Tfp pilus assembly protein FimT